MAVVKATREGALKAFARVDWARLEARTDEQIEAAVSADPDAPPIRTPEEITAARVAGLRKAAGLTQQAFSAAYGIPLGTLRDWEQGKAMPDATARAYLRVIERNPQAVAAALAE